MALWYPPPPPFTGGRQPHAPRQLAPAISAVQVDNPPFSDGGPAAIPSELAAIAQPNPWTYTFLGAGQPFEPKKLSPAIPGQSLDPPPFAHRARVAWFAELVTIWQPNPWVYDYQGRQPYDAKRLAPGIPGQSGDEPPHMLGGPFALKLEAVAIAQPNPWVYDFTGGRAQPYDSRKSAPGIPGQSGDPPPFTLGGPLALKMEGVAVNQPAWSYTAWPYVFAGNRQPYMARQLPAALLAVTVSPFPFSHRGRTAQQATIRDAWNPPPYDFQMLLYAPHHRPQRIAPTARGYIIV
jgi:hypothetical protein